MTTLRWSVLAVLLAWACPAFGVGSMVHDWSQSFGVAESQYSNDVAVDGQGNVVLAGFFRIAVDFGGGVLTSAGDYDGLVAKFDGAGNHVWSKRFGAATYDEATAVAVDGQGNVILTGLFRGTVDFGGGALTSAGGSDIFVAKYDEAGNHVWSYRFGDFYDDGGYAVAVDSQGDVILTGSFYGTVDFGGGVLTSPEDFFIARFGADGTHLWSKGFGDWETQIINRSVAADTQGNVIITGSFLGTVNFGGSAFTSYPGTGHEDYYAAKFDVNGNHVWSNTFWAWGPQRSSSVAVDGQDNVILTGYFQNSVNFGGATLNTPDMFNMDIFVAKFDAGGNHVWSNNFGDASGASPYGDQYAYSGAVDGQGNVIVTGQFFRTLDFGGGVLTNPSGAPAVYVARLDAAGNHLWSKSFGTGNADYEVGRSVTADHQGNVIVTGIFNGTLNFGGAELTSAGLSDIFVAKFTSDGVIPDPPFIDVDPDSGLSAVLLPGESTTQNLQISNLGDLDLVFDNEVLTLCSYLTVDPTLGTVGGDGSADIDLTFNATGFTPGTYDCELIIFSNAVNTNRLAVPLEMIVVAEVAVDIRPAECPNVVVRHSDGDDGNDDGDHERLLQVAIIGSSTLDVTAIDIASIRLAGVPTSSSTVRDVYRVNCDNSPLCTYKQQDLSNDCTSSCTKKDGFKDVVLYFNEEDVVNSLGPVPAGQVNQVTLTGLKTSGIHIQGSDCLIIIEGGHGVAREGGIAGSRYTLGPNVPNPFNPITRFSYYVPKESFVTLSIYDVSGHLLERLVSGVRTPGEHEVSWDAKTLPTGIYFYRLEAGDFVQTRKMILLK